MKNITLAVDEKLIEEGRCYARKHHTSLNALIRELLERTVRDNQSDSVAECLRLMDSANGHSEGRKWSREDLYDV